MADNDLLPEAVLPEIYHQVNVAKTKRYLVGLVPGGPASSHTFHGISFPVSTESYDENGNAYRKDGAVVELTLDQCKAIKDSIKNKIVRWRHYSPDNPEVAKRGQRARAEIWDVRTRGFMPAKGDEPIVKYVIFKEVPAEFVQAPAPAAAFEALDKAIAEAEKSELAALGNPEDAKVRAHHGALKKAGQKLNEGQV